MKAPGSCSTTKRIPDIRNFVNTLEAKPLQASLEARLQERLVQLCDPFETGSAVLARYHVRLNAGGDVFYE